MHDRELELTTADNVRAGLVASVASIAWTVVTSAISVALGVGAQSTVLVAFGAVGFFDAAGSTALVAHFRNALRHEEISIRREWLAQLIVVVGLLTVGTATSLLSIVRLASRAHGPEPVLGVAVSAASVLALGVLALRKRGIARRIPSHALLADSWLSAVGCLIATLTVLGTGLDIAFGWWWVDPCAALGVALAALAVGALNLRHLRARPA